MTLRRLPPPSKIAPPVPDPALVRILVDLVEQAMKRERTA